ncbi:MAG: metal ABC transporter permease [Acidobacteria bacterium]|nr:metal ABC transporter permease [Acidobacteriota bacterium]
MEVITEWRWMLAPLMACLILSVTLVYLGIHVLLRKVIFVDLALAQIAALGATYATALGYDANLSTDSLAVSLFSLAFTFVGAGLFAIARMRKEKVPQEAFIGIVYAAASAAAILILSKSPTGGEELKHMLVGDILLVSMPTIINDVILFSLVAVLHVLFRRQFFAISIDAEGAQSVGINIRLWDLLFYMTFGVLVTRSVSVAGVLLVFSYLIIPAVIAQMWRDSIGGRLVLGWVVAVGASIGGILWSFYSDYPTGPTVVMTLAGALILSGIIYYVLHSETRLRAVLNVSAMVLFGIVFFGTLSQFKKGLSEDTSAASSPIEILLNELKEGETAHQLDAISHLSEMKDPRIVPALLDLLVRTDSEQVTESIAESLATLKDSRAVPGLKSALQKDYDPFLKLTIAKALVELKDKSGYTALIEILKNDEAGFARAQAIEVIQQKSGQDFGYNAEKTVGENKDAIARLERWLKPNLLGKDWHP